MSYFASADIRPWRRLAAELDKVWITSSIRVKLLREGIEKAGSINALARELGYRSRVHPGWSIRQIMLGRQAFPVERLQRLAEFVGTPYEEILRHRVMPSQVTIESTNRALRDAGLRAYIFRGRRLG